MSDLSGYPGAPPGWYTDPAGGPGQRWWDGYAWSQATVLPERPPPPPWAGAVPPQQPPVQAAPWAMVAATLPPVTAAQRVEEERRMAGVGRLALAFPGIAYFVNLLVQRANTDQLRATGHQLRIIWHDAQLDKTAPPYHPPPNAYEPISLLVLIAFIVAVVFACIWQHRAATAGRALGIPSSYSPAWGVGCWFVPIVNLWMPYGAVRACLPPGDPRRAQVLQWWIALLLAWGLAGTSAIVAFASSGAALVIAVPAAVACVAVVATAPRVVRAIAAAHEEALAHQTTGAGTF